VEVSDKGQGFRLSEMAEGRNNMQGLFRIEQRLQLFGGHIQIESTPGLGTRVTLFSPI